MTFLLFVLLAGLLVKQLLVRWFEEALINKSNSFANNSRNLKASVLQLVNALKRHNKAEERPGMSSLNA